MTGQWPKSGVHEKKLENDSASLEGSVNEQSLAMSWNIPRTALANIRKAHLRQYWHWNYGPSKNHGDIRITKEGIEELKKHVVPPDKPVPVPAPESVRVNPPGEFLPGRQAKIGPDVLAPGEVHPPEENIAVVWRVTPNPRMLILVDAHGRHLNLRLTTNSNFRRGMKIDLEKQCVRLEPRGGSELPVYAFRGRLPRLYGRW